MNMNVFHQINMFFAKVKGHGKEGETVGCRAQCQLKKTSIHISALKEVH